MSSWVGFQPTQPPAPLPFVSHPAALLGLRVFPFLSSTEPPQFFLIFGPLTGAISGTLWLLLGA